MNRPPSPMSVAAGLSQVELTRFNADGSSQRVGDQIVVEEPLEIRLSGERFVVTMRTPGHDHELVAGFLLAEGMIQSRDDIGSIVHCGHVGDEGYGNSIDVLPAPGSKGFDPSRELTHRGTLSASACGICGRTTIEDLVSDVQPLDDDTRFSPELVRAATHGLSTAQPNFTRTGGLHAAAITDAQGDYRVVREDIGRHNAVDKAIGRLLLDAELADSNAALVVSGRVSFEIVQKALRATIPIVIGISAPSSLAIATAERARLTLIGFSRQDTFNVYSHAFRIR